MLLCLLSQFKITIKYPKILWKIFNLNTIVPLFQSPKFNELHQKTQQIWPLDVEKKIINKFPTLEFEEEISERTEYKCITYIHYSSSFSVFRDLSCSHMNNLSFLWGPIPAPLQLGWGLWKMCLADWQIRQWSCPFPCIGIPRGKLTASLIHDCTSAHEVQKLVLLLWI